MKNYVKSLNEFVAAEPAIRPTTVPTRPKPATPARPQPMRPSIRPGEKEKGKPMAILGEIMDLFFEELRAIKDTPKGKKMIKKLHQKYVKD